MNGATDLHFLLESANPVLDEQTWVFVCQQAAYGDHAEWQPIATFAEAEGMTFVIRQAIADANDLPYEGTFRRITLQVHSSLSAVGLTARFSACLTEANISANVMAGFYHDHIFVPAADADRAMTALATMAAS